MYASARGLGARASDATEVYPVWNLHYGWLVGAMLSKLLYEFSLTIYSVCIASIMRMTTLTISLKLIPLRFNRHTLPLVPTRAQHRHPLRLPRHLPPSLRQSQPRLPNLLEPQSLHPTWRQVHVPRQHPARQHHAVASGKTRQRWV